MKIHTSYMHIPTYTYIYNDRWMFTFHKLKFNFYIDEYRIEYCGDEDKMKSGNQGAVESTKVG